MKKNSKSQKNYRKFYRVPVIVAIAAVFGAVGLYLLSSSRASPSPIRLCGKFDESHCASLFEGASVYSGEHIVVIGHTNSWWWIPVSVNTIRPAGSPFKYAWLNNKYGSDPVIAYQLKFNRSYCMANSGTDILLRLCNVESTAQQWVTSGGWKINVSATDNHNTQYVMTDYKGGFYDLDAGSYPSIDQNWSYFSQ